jgi:hypothetical protein
VIRDDHDVAARRAAANPFHMQDIIEPQHKQSVKAKMLVDASMRVNAFCIN